MKRIITSALVAVTISGGIIFNPVGTHALTIDGNTGSIIRTSQGGTVEATGAAGNVTGNIGSIVKIDGEGRDVNEVLNEINVSKNTGSIIKIDNVCGTVDETLHASNNIGTIIKVDSTGDCTATTIASTTTESSDTPSELPRTGIDSLLITATVVGVVTAGIAYVIRRHA